MGGPKQNHLKALAHADAIMRHCKKDGIAKCEVITGELKVLGDMGLRDFQVRENRHDRRSLGLGSEDQRNCNFLAT